RERLRGQARGFSEIHRIHPPDRVLLGDCQRSAAGRPEIMTEATISSPAVHILHLEDNAHDHVLVREMLAAEGLSCDFALARSRPEFEAALQRGPYDLIISDYSLPAYDGLEALSLVRRLQM